MRKKIVKSRSKKLSVCARAKEYEKDFFKWTHHQAQLLRKGEFSKLDINNLIEEIESLG